MDYKSASYLKAVICCHPTLPLMCPQNFALLGQNILNGLVQHGRIHSIHKEKERKKRNHCCHFTPPITIFKFITMFYGTDNILCGIQTKCVEYSRILGEILSVPQNTILDMNNVMPSRCPWNFATTSTMVEEMHSLLTLCVHSVINELHVYMSNIFLELCILDWQDFGNNLCMYTTLHYSNINISKYIRHIIILVLLFLSLTYTFKTI